LATSLIDAGDVAEIFQVRRDGLATAFALADPGPFSCTLSRRSGGDIDEGDATDVILTWDRVRGAGQGSAREDIMATVPMTGQLRAYEGWDVKRNDRFALPDGRVGIIDSVPPPKNGAQKARFSVDLGR
jgi:hypothetical protein